MSLPFCSDEIFLLHMQMLTRAQTDCLEGYLNLTLLTCRQAHSSPWPSGSQGLFLSASPLEESTVQPRLSYNKSLGSAKLAFSKNNNRFSKPPSISRPGIFNSFKHFTLFPLIPQILQFGNDGSMFWKVHGWELHHLHAFSNTRTPNRQKIFNPHCTCQD